MLTSKLTILSELFDEKYDVKFKSIDGTAVTLEGEANGEAHDELEKVFYCKIADFSELEKAAKQEHHEQWSLKPETDIKGGIRVRSIDRGKEYILTIKNEGQEVEMPITEDMFTFFRSLSNNGMVKTRYEFPIEGSDLKWEVDVYYEKDGTGQEPWCKVDLEVGTNAALNSNARPPFPIEFSEVISGDRSKLTEEQNAFLDNLFETVFITRNDYNDAREYSDDRSDDDSVDQGKEA